jgi:hypothetical protein
MRKQISMLALVILGAATMYGQATRTWVSGVGDDANPCSRTAPCKTFAGAISKTAPGGEIDALDPGGFGALTITKSITLDGGGGQVASVLVAGTNGIVVAPAANDVVIIRNLRLDGLLGNGTNSGNAGINGIRWISGKSLHVENCWIFGFNQNGIDIEKADGGHAFITGTTVVNNAVAGILSNNTTTTVSTSIVDSHSKDNLFGIATQAFSKVSVFKSEIAGNVNTGLQASSGSAGTILDVFDSVVAHNGIPLITTGAGGPVANVSRTAFFENASGWLISSGAINSTHDNPNTVAGSGASGTVTQQ